MKVCSTCRRCYGDRVESCTDQFHPPLSETIPGDPDMIDGYRLELLLLSEFSVGLFRAKRTDSGPSCLIKVVSGDDVDKFLTQARTASQFFHPNVTDVYEAGLLDDGRCYLAMEDPDGMTIREMLDAEEAQPLLRSVEIVRQAAEALHAMHLAGLAHGAVNPRNIVVNLDGEILVRVHNPDLGSVAQRSIVSNKFLIDTALDSIRYFAPEQFNGEPACAQTDVYSLGIVFYEMLTGTPPFDAPTATALIHKQRTQSPPDIRITDFNLRMLVTHCLMESLQKQSRLRQVSANLFARQLRHIEQLATHTSTPPPAGVVPPQPVPVVKSASPAAVIIGPPVESNAPVQLEAKREVEATKPVVVEMPKAEPVKVLEDLPVVIPAEPLPVEKPVPAIMAEALPVELVKAPTPIEVVPAREEEVVAAPVPVEVLQVNEEAPIPQNEKVPDELLVSTTLVTQTHDTRPHRSRLRRLKKKLHTMSADLVAHVNTAVKETTVSEPVIVESIPEPVIRAERPERILVAESIPEPAVIATKKPIKIAFETPDDDVPSVAAVLEVLSQETSNEPAPVFQEPAIAEVVETPAPPEREPETVFAVAARQEAVVPEPAVSEPTAEPTIIATKKPIKVALEIPDDDIPSVAEVLEVLSKEASSEPPPAFQQPSVPEVVETPAPPVSEPQPVFAVAAAAASTTPSVMVPAKRTGPKPRKLIESAPQPKVIPTSSPRKVVPTAPSQRRAEKELTATPVMVQPDPEEITRVRPPARRIRIDLEGARPAGRGTWKSEAAFTPTLLGNQKKRPTAKASSDAMFAAYYGDTAGMTSIPYRSLSTAVGAVALIMLFLFAGSSLSRYFQSAGSGDSSTTIASSATQTALTPIATQAKVEPVVVEQTVPTKSVEPERTQPAVSKPSKDKQEEPAAEAKVTKNPVIDKKPAVTSAAPRAPQTAVKKNNTVEPMKPKTVLIVKNRSSLLTRPRIVKDPKQ